MDWFTVDKEGLAALLERRGKIHAVLELLQNAFDEDGVTEVVVSLDRAHSRRGRSRLAVVDDAPDGFADLTHAFTLFAPSRKINDTHKRGRFNFGEKLVLAICDEANVTSTTGGYRFDANGRNRTRDKRERGSQFSAVIRFTAEDRKQFDDLVRTVIVPEGIRLVYNGETMPQRVPVRTFTASLRTEIADEEGVLRPTQRNTDVRLYETIGDEKPMIYEMGIPVVEHNGRWHIDIGQKVPLSFTRDNVTPAYAQDLRVAVLNATHDLISKDDATTPWIRRAAGDDRATEQSVVTVLRHRFGDKAVAYDPHDRQANQEAVLRGYTVVPGGAMGRSEWEQVRKSGALRPAGQVTPSNSTVLTAPDGVPPIPFDDWTDGMVRMAEYAVALAKELLGIDIKVDIHRIMQHFNAAYRDGYLTFNLQWLGHRFFDEPDQARVDALLIHEFAHQQVSNHLSEDFHQEICRLGARLRDIDLRLAL